MSITGGVKFFNRNQALFEFGATATASSGEVAIARALDKNPITKWRSLGSSDSSTETITVTLPDAITIDRIILQDHNFKQFQVKYDSSGMFTDFTNVLGIDGSLGGGISETAFADDTAYYEFDSVTTSSIQLTIDTTQTVDAEKFISQIIVTSEIGTFNGFPLISGITPSRNQRNRKVLSGRSIVQKGQETMAFDLDFSNYGVSKADFRADLDIAMTLFDREDPFLVWLCGGRRGSDYFRYTLRGFRLKDIYQMQTLNDYELSYRDNVYINPASLKVDLEEAV